MNPRPKSLIVLAIMFALDAVFCLHAAWRWGQYFLTHPEMRVTIGFAWRLTMGVWFVVAAIGILRVSPWARVMGLCLGCASLAVMAAFLHQINPTLFYSRPDIAYKSGFLIGIGILIAWAGLPLYILTRRKCADAFADRAAGNRVNESFT